MSNKRRRLESEADQQASEQLGRAVAEVNRRRGTTPLYVCNGCGTLRIGHGRLMPTSPDGGISYPYCRDCIYRCSGCGDDYVEALGWWHDDCSVSEENDDEGSGNSSDGETSS